jgi:nucleoside-diphosphate-sugar epimerase
MLIVGGTGFIGHHLCVESIRRGHAVTSLSTSRPASPVPGVRYLVGDVSRNPVAPELADGLDFEYVVNAGGYIDHSGLSGDGRRVVDVHFGGTLNLVAACKRDVLKRFVQIGSSDEYGSAAAPQREAMREEPIAPYSFAKTAATHLLQTLWRSERFPAATARLFLVYGPGQNERRFLPQLIAGCLQGRRFPVSEGAQLRDFCHVSDVADGILAMLAAPQACGEVINIASGIPVSIAQMIKRVRALVGAGEPQFGEIAYRRGESMALYADVSKAAALLGWSPQIAFDAGLQSTIDWYRTKLNVE